MRLIRSSEQSLQPVSHDAELTKRVILSGGSAPGITQLALVKLAPGQGTHSHRHGDMTEVFWVVDGVGISDVDGVRRNVSAGDCLVIEPGELHSFLNDSAADLSLLYFGLVAGE
jgi:quercetin dioxygenase-like cupin family protein